MFMINDDDDDHDNIDNYDDDDEMSYLEESHSLLVMRSHHSL